MGSKLSTGFRSKLLIQVRSGNIRWRSKNQTSRAGELRLNYVVYVSNLRQVILQLRGRTYPQLRVGHIYVKVG